MKIISFRDTIEALLAGVKTQTRRLWSDLYAARFKKGEIYQAWDKSPRNGGKLIGFLKIKRIYKQKIYDISWDDWFQEGGHLLPGGLDWLKKNFGNKGMVWVVEFEFVSIEEVEEMGRIVQGSPHPIPLPQRGEGEKGKIKQIGNDRDRIEDNKLCENFKGEKGARSDLKVGSVKTRSDHIGK